MKIILTLLLISSVAFADEFEKLQREVQALQEARKADREQQQDPFYWSMREQIEDRHITGYESRTSRALKRQLLIDSYPEYFDSDYNYRKAEKYLDLDHDGW
jgi:hypothetical protein